MTIDVFFTTICWLGGVVLAMFLLTVLFGAPFVPTHTRQFKKLLKHISPDPANDVLVDLGAGDGKILKLSAAGVKSAIGYEINPFLWALAKFNLTKIANAQVKLANFNKTDLPAETTIIYIFSAGNFKTTIVNLISNHLKKHQRPITLISYGFEFEEFGKSELHHGFHIYRLKSTSQKSEKSV